MECEICHVSNDIMVLLIGQDGRQIVRCSDKDHTILTWGDFYKGYTVTPRLKREIVRK